MSANASAYSKSGYKLTGYQNGAPVYEAPPIYLGGNSATGSTSGGGVVNYGGGGLSALMQQMEDARNKANAANEARYQQALGLSRQNYNDLGAGWNDIVGSASGRYSRLMSMLDGQGLQAKSDTRQDYSNALNSGMANLSSRGMAGTTSAANLGSNNQKQLDAAMNRLNENLNAQRIGYDTSLSKDIEGAKASRLSALSNALGGQINLIGSKEDVAPDYTALLMQMAGNLGGQGGGGGGLFASRSGGSSSVNAPAVPFDPWGGRTVGLGPAITKEGAVAGTLDASNRRYAALATNAHKNQVAGMFSPSAMGDPGYRQAPLIAPKPAKYQSLTSNFGLSNLFRS